MYQKGVYVSEAFENGCKTSLIQLGFATLELSSQARCVMFDDKHKKNSNNMINILS